MTTKTITADVQTGALLDQLSLDAEPEQIEELLEEAGTAGDLEQVAICALALGIPEDEFEAAWPLLSDIRWPTYSRWDALRDCVEVIEAAKAMADEG